MSSQAEPETAEEFSDMLIGAARTIDVVMMKRAMVYFELPPPPRLREGAKTTVQCKQVYLRSRERRSASTRTYKRLGMSGFS